MTDTLEVTLKDRLFEDAPDVLYARLQEKGIPIVGQSLEVSKGSLRVRENLTDATTSFLWTSAPPKDYRGADMPQPIVVTINRSEVLELRNPSIYIISMLVKAGIPINGIFLFQGVLSGTLLEEVSKGGGTFTYTWIPPCPT